MQKWAQRILKKSLLVNRLKDKIYNSYKNVVNGTNVQTEKENTNQNNLKHTDFYTNELH